MNSILVTGVGGVVGQGVARNLERLRKINHSFCYNIIGADISPLSAGNHLCHAVYKVPYAYCPFYISEMLDICKKEGVNLIIPSTDYEVYHLSKNKHLFNCAIAVSGIEATGISLDKYKNYIAFKKHDIPFAQSVLPSEYTHFDKYVVKPREGRGSRNIYFNPDNPKDFDDTYIIQKQLEGDEITTAIYITRRGDIHGMITFIRNLEQGCTVQAEVIKDYDKDMYKIAEKMVSAFQYRGSVNLQSIVTRDGVIPFEVNCRISGTNSIRANFGFEDVKYTVEEYLLNHNPSKPDVKEGCAIRVLMDVIYPFKKLKDVQNVNDKFYIA